jgi:hypothetical protein
MIIEHGLGRTIYGPGVDIHLTGTEVARAIHAWLTAQGVHIEGARTIRVNGQLCADCRVYVDPSGSVITPDGERINGHGK